MQAIWHDVDPAVKWHWETGDHTLKQKADHLNKPQKQHFNLPEMIVVLAVTCCRTDPAMSNVNAVDLNDLRSALHKVCCCEHWYTGTVTTIIL